jgi:hypothetical protein
MPNQPNLIFTPIWVRMQGNPLIFWFEEVFKDIGNSLSLFYEVDCSFQDNGNMGMTKVLLGLELSKGLENFIINEKGSTFFY